MGEVGKSHERIEHSPGELFEHHFSQADISNLKTAPQSGNLRGGHHHQPHFPPHTPHNTPLTPHPLLAEVKREFAD